MYTYKSAEFGGWLPPPIPDGRTARTLRDQRHQTVPRTIPRKVTRSIIDRGELSRMKVKSANDTEHTLSFQSVRMAGQCGLSTAVSRSVDVVVERTLHLSSKA